MKRTRILMLFLGTLLCSIQLFAQQVSVQGTVYDPSGVTLPGTSVFVKGNSQVGTVTDLDGRFTLNVKPGDILVASFIGTSHSILIIPRSGSRKANGVLSPCSRSATRVATPVRDSLLPILSGDVIS